MNIATDDDYKNHQEQGNSTTRRGAYSDPRHHNQATSVSGSFRRKMISLLVMVVLIVTTFIPVASSFPSSSSAALKPSSSFSTKNPSTFYRQFDTKTLIKAMQNIENVLFRRLSGNDGGQKNEQTMMMIPLERSFSDQIIRSLSSLPSSSSSKHHGRPTKRVVDNEKRISDTSTLNDCFFSPLQCDMQDRRRKRQFLQSFF